MIQIVLHRSLSQDIASSDVRQEEQGDISLGRRDKSADCRRAFLVVESGGLRASREIACRRFCQNVRKNNRSGAVAYAEHLGDDCESARQ